ncbi:MAG: 3-oxoacyl-ACP reductase [Gemmatimonadetes bacterium]|nr:MAG: 3-oxoacyl-ACP reductase [Gemmatimonadota bacterium]
MSKRQPEGAVQAAPQEGAGAAHGAAGPTLAGKVVLITGASSGIGRAIALACAEAGADLALTYRANRRGADDTAERVRGHGRRVELYSVDVADEPALETLATRARDAFGRVDVWVNNAGADILTGEASRLTWVEKLDRLLAVDLRGTVVASWKAVALMRAQPAGGVILNVSWDHVLGGGAKGGYAEVFCAAKGGVYSFSRALARSVAPHIRVNVLGPGWIETAYGESLDPTVKERITRSIPLGRWGSAQDVAYAAVYLASDAASYVTGQMLMINGGGVV